MLSVCHIRRSNVAHHIYVCMSIFGVRMPIYHLIQLNVHLSFCYMFVYISLYTYPFARLFVRLSHVGILSTPLNISAIFTARRICIARTMQRQHVCPTARHSVYLTLRPSVIRQASRPAHMYFCLLLFLYLYSSTPAYIHHIHTHNVFHICLCFCVHMPVYSYVPVCPSTTFIYKLLYAPFYVSIFM